MTQTLLLDSINESNCPPNYLKYIPYFQALTSLTSADLVKNIKAELKILRINDHLCPISIHDPYSESTYTCSMKGSLEFTREKLLKSNNWIQKRLGANLLALSSCIVTPLHVDKVIIVDNWLFPTNTYPDLETKDLEAATTLLTQKYPDHAILFNFINASMNADLLTRLHSCGYKSLTWKTSVIVDPTKDFRFTSYIKRDFSLHKNTHFISVNHDEFTPKDYPRIVKLYNMLFLEKHTFRNLQITEAFIKVCHENSILHFLGVRNPEGELEGVTALFIKGNKMIDPIIGYNTSLPKKLGIYRIMKSMQLRYVLDHKLVHNCGSGAIEFKKLRGGIISRDHIAWYTDHLPYKRRFTYQLIEKGFQASRRLFDSF